MPIIAVAQMNRSKNEDKSLDSSQIGLSDLIPQYATVLLMLEKEVVEKEDGSYETRLKINTAKARDGGDNHTLVYKVNFNKGYFDFLEEKAMNKKQAEETKNRYKKESGDVVFGN